VSQAFSPDIDPALICRAVRRETHDVRTFVFAPRTGDYVAFEAGQFLTFAFPVDGKIIERCYTIASPPTRPGVVSITVKRVPGGPVSNWLHDHMKPGMVVNAIGPNGIFTLPEGPAPKLLLLSGGSGITPVMSMLRTLYDRAEEADLVFAHSARTGDDVIFQDELGLMARHMPGLRLAYISETAHWRDRWAGFRGRLDRGIIEHLAPDLAQRRVLTCGPAGYMAAVRGLLGEMSFDMSRYHQESFDLSAPLPAVEVETVIAGESAGFRVQFSSSGKEAVCDARTTVLAAARAMDLMIPASCEKGVCGTCKSKLVSGEVEMTHGGGIRPREIAMGLFLPCCARPKTDLVVER
jgi:ferredoxin-NADP reductase